MAFLRTRGLLFSLLLFGELTLGPGVCIFLSAVPRRPEAERLLPKIQGSLYSCQLCHGGQRLKGSYLRSRGHYIPVNCATEARGWKAPTWDPGTCCLPRSCLLRYGGQRLIGSYLRSRGLLSSSLLSSALWRSEAERLLPEIQEPAFLLTPVFFATEVRGWKAPTWDPGVCCLPRSYPRPQRSSRWAWKSLIWWDVLISRQDKQCCQYFICFSYSSKGSPALAVFRHKSIKIFLS
jgi:hypothetical protein